MLKLLELLQAPSPKETAIMENDLAEAGSPWSPTETCIPRQSLKLQGQRE